MNSDYKKYMIILFIITLVYTSSLMGQAGLNTTLIGKCEFMGLCTVSATKGNICIVGSDHVIDILDISEPFKPIRIGKPIPDKGRIFDIFIDEDYAYLATFNGFHILDISDLYNPMEIYCDTTIFPWGVAVKGDFVYIVDESILRIKNISDPFHPVDVGMTDDLGSPRAVTINENFAYPKFTTIFKKNLKKRSKSMLTSIFRYNILL